MKNFMAKSYGALVSYARAILPLEIRKDHGTLNKLKISCKGLPKYYAGIRVFVKPKHTNTSAATININNLGEQNILNVYGKELIEGDIDKNSKIELIYNGEDFQILIKY
jgi:hypothetical protein